MSRLPSISSLMSPPEPDLIQSFDSFTKSQFNMASIEDPLPPINKLRPINASSEVEATRKPPSPPQSPAVLSQQKDVQGKKPQLRPSGDEVRDPLLYPRESSEISTSQSPSSTNPLFPTSTAEDAIEEAIKRHIRDNAHHFVKPKSKGDTRKLRYEMPSLEEYRLAVTFVSSIARDYHGNSAAYFRKTQEENRAYYSMAKRMGARPSSMLPLEKRPKVLIPRSPASKVVKAESNSKKPATPRAKPTSRVPKTGSPRSARALTPAVRHREPKKPIDYNFSALPDFCPPTSILDNNPKALKIDWDGSPKALDDDPHRHLLHEAEFSLACCLRLECSRYLVCKRKIFMARVEALKIGKEFKKTDAQQACQIDVNKASKIWMAYEKVGWLNPALFRQYL